VGQRAYCPRNVLVRKRARKPEASSKRLPGSGVEIVDVPTVMEASAVRRFPLEMLSRSGLKSGELGSTLKRS
jgi:hypothetical protein